MSSSSMNEDLQQTLEKEAIKQMKKCIVPNCKFLSLSASKKNQLCELCWMAYMFACNTFEKQYSMLEEYVPLEESKNKKS